MLPDKPQVDEENVLGFSRASFPKEGVAREISCKESGKEQWNGPQVAWRGSMLVTFLPQAAKSFHRPAWSGGCDGEVRAPWSRYWDSQKLKPFLRCLVGQNVQTDGVHKLEPAFESRSFLVDAGPHTQASSHSRDSEASASGSQGLRSKASGRKKVPHWGGLSLGMFECFSEDLSGE